MWLRLKVCSVNDDVSVAIDVSVSVDADVYVA